MAYVKKTEFTERKYDYAYQGKSNHGGYRHKIHIQTDRAVLDIDKLKSIVASKGAPKNAKARAQGKLDVLERCDYECVECGETEALTIYAPLKNDINKYSPYIYNNSAEILCVWCHMEKLGDRR